MFAGSATEKGGNEEEDVEGTRRRTAVWMTVGDPRRRYPIRPSNDRLPCFCVSTAPVFPLARAGSTRGFSTPVLGPAVLPPSPPLIPLSTFLYHAVVITGYRSRSRRNARGKKEKSIDLTFKRQLRQKREISSRFTRLGEHVR